MISKMGFITRLFTSCNRAFFVGVVLLSSLSVRAEGISVSRAQAALASNGQLSISTRFQTQLPEQLKEALQQGVPLTFQLSYQLTEPTLVAYKIRFNQLFQPAAPVQYRLSYHPLTSRYRVTIGTFSTEYVSLDTALRSVGAIANWRVLSSGSLSGYGADEVKAAVRLNLSTNQLPKPFQINAMTSRNWQLDTGWVRVGVQQE